MEVKKKQAPRGTILIRDGYPEDKTAFVNSCLLAAFAVAYMIKEEVRQGTSPYKKALQDMQHLSGQLKKGVSLTKQNQVGRKVLQHMKELIEPLTICLDGPHEYSDLSKLCNHYKVQVIIYNELLGWQPAHLFPLNFPQPRADWPTLHFRERASLHEGASLHLDVVISPQAAFPYRFNCSLCLRSMSCARKHIQCAVRRACFKCHRGELLPPHDHFDASMSQTFCAACLAPHPAITVINNRCPTCQDIVITESCFKYP